MLISVQQVEQEKTRRIALESSVKNTLTADCPLAEIERCNRLSFGEYCEQCKTASDFISTCPANRPLTDSEREKFDTKLINQLVQEIEKEQILDSDTIDLLIDNLFEKLQELSGVKVSEDNIDFSECKNLENVKAIATVVELVKENIDSIRICLLKSLLEELAGEIDNWDH